MSEPNRFSALEAALASARDRGFPVVDEGCDCRADFDMLVALACDGAQGNWVGRPAVTRR